MVCNTTTTTTQLTLLPRLHGVFGEIYDPVDEVEGAKREREKNARVLVDNAGAAQHVVGRRGRALRPIVVQLRAELLSRRLQAAAQVHSFL